MFNEKDNVLPLYEEIVNALKPEGWTYEILLIDDGSTDGTGEQLKKIRQADPRVRVYSFRKRLGKSQALDYGFRRAQGRFVVTLDGDLQDDPKEIKTLWGCMHETGADVVSGWKKNRVDPPSKIISSRLFNFAVRVATGIDLHDFNCGLKLYRRTVIREIALYGELHRFIPALAAWEGYRVTETAVRHRPRKFGRSKFGLMRFFGGVVDILTIMFLLRYQGKPSHLFSGLGIILAAVGILINSDLLLRKLTGGTIAPHYPYMALGVTALVVGVQFIFFGLLAE
ncbi:MAG: glycosyl transferase family 2, partial [Omnitrophica bacterium GWA2_50_21]